MKAVIFRSWRQGNLIAEQTQHFISFFHTLRIGTFVFKTVIEGVYSILRFFQIGRNLIPLHTLVLYSKAYKYQWNESYIPIRRMIRNFNSYSSTLSDSSPILVWTRSTTWDARLEKMDSISSCIPIYSLHSSHSYGLSGIRDSFQPPQFAP